MSAGLGYQRYLQAISCRKTRSGYPTEYPAGDVGETWGYTCGLGGECGFVARADDAALPPRFQEITALRDITFSKAGCGGPDQRGAIVNLTVGGANTYPVDSHRGLRRYRVSPDTCRRSGQYEWFTSGCWLTGRPAHAGVRGARRMQRRWLRDDRRQLQQNVECVANPRASRPVATYWLLPEYYRQIGWRDSARGPSPPGRMRGDCSHLHAREC